MHEGLSAPREIKDADFAAIDPHDFDDEEIRDISPSNRILTPITIK